MNLQASVIIPAYNRREMLRDAIASVLAQRGIALELIIVDDGSTDGTWDDLRCGPIAQMLERAPANCHVVIERTPHRGPAAARNHGVAQAGADYIAFLDSDDLWMAEKLSRQLAYAQEHREYPIVQTQELWMRNGRRVNPGRRHQKRAGDIFEPSLRTCLVSPSAVMMRTVLFRELGGFDESMAACEDYDLWLRILSRHRIGLLDEPLVIRRAGHPNQLSATVVALDRFRVRALLKLIAAGALAPLKRRAVVAVLAEKCAIVAAGLKRRGHVNMAEFYTAVERSAQALLDGGPEPDDTFWSDALGRQPLDLEPP
jgi:glycosyltransferase involved in cell wall biosynthesis